MGRARNPRFFKIILPCVLEDCGLRIPRTFMEKHGHLLSRCDSVYLQVPSGTIWEVKLMKYEGHLWLHEGWQKFAEYYSITYGHFLVFSFHGNSLFRVIICDLSASEIEYPVDDITTSHPDYIKLDDKTDCRAPEMDGFPPNNVKTGAEVEQGYVQPATIRAKKRIVHDLGGLPQAVKSKRSHCARKEQASHNCTHDVKDSTLRRAESMKCNGPSFMVQIKPSHVSYKPNLQIPQYFKEYLAGKHDHVLLMGQEPETKPWLVKCYIHPLGSIRLTKGWNDFASDNHMVVGDVCVFELIKANLYKVRIFYAAKDGRQVYNTHPDTVKDRVVKAFNDDGDVSIEILDNLPTESVKAEEGYVQLGTIRPKKRSNLDPCGLPQGVLSKKSCSAGKETSWSYVPRERSHISTPNERDRALQRAKALRCNGPSFIVQLRPSHVSDRFRVHIPNHFTEHLAGKHDNVVLMGQGPETKTWTVKCYIHPGSSKLTTGWKEFALDNHLVVGDVCVFELIKENAYKVIIFRFAQGSGTVKDDVLQRTKTLNSESPKFRVIMQPSNIEGRCMAIPKHFHKYFTRKESKVVSLINGTEGKSWNVSCYFWKQKVMFCSGWRSFARDNHLKVGDVCVFEMMDGVWNSYKVTISRQSEEA